MSAVIRLSRYGKRNHPVYRVVVADSRKARDGQFIEQVGFYDPHPASPDTRFETDKVMKWLNVGAQPSDTVASLLRKLGILDLFHAQKAGRDILGKAPVARPAKAKKPQLGPKAKARIAAEKAAKEAPAQEG